MSYYNVIDFYEGKKMTDIKGSTLNRIFEMLRDMAKKKHSNNKKRSKNKKK